MNSKEKPSVWLLASVRKELEPFMEFWKVLHSRSFYGQYKWKMLDSEGRSILAATTGIGKSNAAFTVGVLTKNRIKPLLIVNIGIAGAYDSNPITPGDVVIVTKCIMGDEGVWEGYDRFLSYEAIGIPPLRSIMDTPYGCISLEDSPTLKQILGALPPGRYVPRELLPEKIINHGGKGLTKSFNLWYGSTSSVGLASGSPHIASIRSKIYGAWIEEMESSAVLLGALRAGIPAIVIRGISNRAGDRNRSGWEIERAIYNVCAVTIRILQNGTIIDGEYKRWRA